MDALKSLLTFLRGLPIAGWVATASNTLKQFGLVFSVLAALFLVVYLIPDGFSPSQRLGILKGIGGAAVLTMLIVAYLSTRPTDPLYAPFERTANLSLAYGDRRRPRTRQTLLNENREAVQPQLPAPPTAAPEQVSDDER